MKSSDVGLILEDMAENQDQSLDSNQVLALHFAIAVIHSLPENSIRLIDAIFDLAYPTPSV